MLSKRDNHYTTETPQHPSTLVFFFDFCTFSLWQTEREPVSTQVSTGDLSREEKASGTKRTKLESLTLTIPRCLQSGRYVLHRRHLLCFAPKPSHCFYSVSNRGTFACEANVIITTLQKRVASTRDGQLLRTSSTSRWFKTDHANVVLTFRE